MYAYNMVVVAHVMYRIESTYYVDGLNVFRVRTDYVYRCVSNGNTHVYL